MKFVCLFVTFFYTTTYGQKINSEKVNTSAAQAYINIATKIQSGDSANSIKWSKLFSTLPYQMMIQGGAIDTTTFKSDMLTVFSPSYLENNSLQNERQFYHYEYKKILSVLEGYVKRLDSTDVVDSVKKLLYPFLPQRLQLTELFPKLFYLYYGTPDATGMSGLVLNDLLLSYKIDNYKFGALTSHEAFHAIVSVAFQQKLKENINSNSLEFNLLYFMENISEEGIADLIDKTILGQKNSPVYETVNKLRNNDSTLSIVYIKRIDSLLTITNTSDSLLNKYSSFAALSNHFGKNGGHIPGRFMALVIKEGRVLNAKIQSVEDPIAFFLNYNQAVIKLKKKKYPVFSDASVSYLKKLKNKMLKK